MVICGFVFAGIVKTSIDYLGICAILMMYIYVQNAPGIRKIKAEIRSMK